ncbi:MAG: SusC/RagA family TonB-linked outer membrane protein [Bacteroidales bacterium]|nr:SusC/RagA family TonB-linked outer membrane protein [Bacteroidales bacterium]
MQKKLEKGILHSTDITRSVRKTCKCSYLIKTIMRITLIQIVMTLIFCSVISAHDSYGQGMLNREVTLKCDNVSLKAVLSRIEQQVSVKFAYSGSILNIDDNVTLDATNEKLEKVLDNILTPRKILYAEEDDFIILTQFKNRGKSKLDEISFVFSNQNQLERVITGTVKDPKGIPVPGVNIMVKGTKKGTSTNAEGKYSIICSDNSVLVATCIGYNKQEITVGKRSVVDIDIEENASELEAITINAGYYTVTEKTKTGNIAKVTAKEIANQPVTSPLMALQGRVAGLEITSPVGPGVAPTIRIRGHNSLRTTDLGKSIPGSTGIDGNLPLYIIDGIPVSSEALNLSLNSMWKFGGRLDPLSTINPENIQGIEVLKDADATAIYGSRGSNGVILITTKKGQSGKTDLDINFYQGAGNITRRLDLLSTQKYLAMRREAYRNDGIDLNSPDWNNETSKLYEYPDLAIWDTTRYTNWQKELLSGTADITDLQLNVTGGNANTTFRLGGSYHREGMIYDGHGYSRIGGNLNLNHTSDNGKFTAGVAVNYGVDNNKSGVGLMDVARRLAPNSPPLYLENGELNWALNSAGIPTWTNPVASFANPAISNNRNLTVSANLSFLLFQGLRVKMNLGYTDLNGDSKYKEPTTGYSPNIRKYFTPSAEFCTNHRQSLLIEPQLSYIRTFGKHAIDFIAGFSYQGNINDYKELKGTKYSSDALLNSIDAAGAIAVASNYSNYKYNSVFARIGYNYKERYLLNLTGRREGSSRFGPKNRFGNFGAIGGAWIFSSEPWIQKNLPILTFGKLRASYGVTGNDMIGDYMYYDLYEMAPSTIAYEGSLSLYPNMLFNPDFKWEQTSKLEVAFESYFFNNRLGLEVSWYRNRSSNQLVDYTLPATTGFSSVLKNFEATVENSGCEVLLRGDLIRSEHFQWNLAANISLPQNKLVSFPGIEDSPYATIYKVGEPLSIERTYIWTGVDPQTGLYTFLDVDDNGVINSSDQQFTYCRDSKFYGGLTNNLVYKGFELSFLLRFKQQIARYKPNNDAGIINQNAPLWVWNERWQKPGDITDVSRFSQSYDTASNYMESDAMTDASFIKLQTLSLSYTLPQIMAKKAGAKMVKIFVQGQNLFTISRYNRYVLDVETQSYPLLTIITAGLLLKF